MPAGDMTQVLGWAFVTMGGALIAVLVWVALGIFARLDRLESLLDSESRDLRALYHGMDKRIVWIESNCLIRHPNHEQYPAGD